MHSLHERLSEGVRWAPPIGNLNPLAFRSKLRHHRVMRHALAIMLAFLAAPAAAQADLAGRYRLDEGPDAAGQLVLQDDGRFYYAMSVGALDEGAQGRWESKDGKACLQTVPKPVPPVFSRISAGTARERTATLQVVWPDGEGVAGVNFTLGFDDGEPIRSYTQQDGWSMPAQEPRQPRWVEVGIPMYGIASPRFAFEAADSGRLRILLTPNDMGVVDFGGACLEAKDGRFILHRKEGEMRFASWPTQTSEDDSADGSPPN